MRLSRDGLDGGGRCGRDSLFGIDGDGLGGEIVCLRRMELGRGEAPALSFRWGQRGTFLIVR